MNGSGPAAAQRPKPTSIEGMRRAERGTRSGECDEWLFRRCPGFQERRRQPFLEAVLHPLVQQWLYRSPWLVFSLSETTAVQVTVHKWRQFNSKD
jgi:hypothetical protein